MTRRGRLLVRIALATPALALLLAAAAAIRLATGPVPLNFLTGPAERRIAGAVPGLDLAFSTLSVFWNRDSGTLELRLGEATAHSERGDWHLSGPEFALALDVAPLLSAELRPRSLIVLGAEVGLSWQAPEPDTEWKGLPAFALPRPLADALAGLVLPGTPGHEMLGTLESLQFRGGGLTLTEARSGKAHRLDDISLELARGPEGVALEGDARLEDGGIVLSGKVAPDGALRLTLAFEHLVAARLAEGLDLLAPLSGLSMPVDAEIVAEADRRGKVRHLAVDLATGAGNLTLPPDYPEPLSFDGLSATATYDAAAGRIELEELAAEFAGQAFFANGSILFAEDADGPELDLEGGFGPIDVAALVAYWPRTRAADGRRWVVERLTRGIVSDAQFSLLLASADRRRENLPSDALQLTFAFAGLKGHYLPPMPPLEDASGRGSLTADALRLEIARGSIDGVSTAGSTVLLDRLQSQEQWGDIDLRLAAPLPDMLRLVDHPPLGYASDFGIRPDDVSGAAEVRARLGVPLLRDVALSDIDLAVEVELADLGIAQLVGEHALEEGRLYLAIDRGGVEGSGTASIAGIPLDLEWTEDFAADDSIPSSRYRARGRVSVDDLQRLGLDPGPRVAGSFGVDLSLEADGPEIHRGRLVADLLKTQVELPELDWRKMKGTPARLALATSFGNGTPLQLDELDFRSGPNEIRARDIAFEPGFGSLRRAVFERLRLGRTDLSGRVENPAEGALSIDIEGSSFDAAPLLAAFDTGSVGAGDQAAGVRPLELDFRAGRVFGLEGEMFEDVVLHAARDERMWRHMSLDARLAGDGTLSLSLDPADEDDTRNFSLVAGNAGRALKGTGLFANAEGGRLEVDARLAGFGPQVTIAGLARLRDFRLVRSESVDASIEEEARSRLDDFIDDGGMSFNEMMLPFRLADGIIDLDDARANGPRLGLTIEGQLDQAMERVNINGVIVPAYWLNSILGNIPLLGRIFTGGEGGGLFALAYRIKGPTSDPEVSVNALSAIMPGILRRPFEGSKGRIEPPDGRRKEEEPGQ